jgi:hypothetical protein
MSGHEHAELMLEYAQDALTNENPWELWEGKHDYGDWETLGINPSWSKSFEYRRKPVKWSPVGGDWWITSNNDIVPATVSINCEQATLFGTRRPTQEQAERAAVEMRRFNRLLALRDELCGDDVPDWNLEEFEKWKLFLHIYDKKWVVSLNRNHQDVSVYFTTREHAQRACDMLNSGEVEL